jgi:hypothetical protein
VFVAAFCLAVAAWRSAVWLQQQVQLAQHCVPCRAACRLHPLLCTGQGAQR